MKEIEIEYKAILKKEEFEQIKKDIEFKYYVEQINYYFETDDMKLASKKMSLRVRNIEEKHYLMLKVWNGIVADETNVEISFDAFKLLTQKGIIIDSEVKDEILKHHIDEPLLNQATLKTFRYYTPYKDCVLFIDESHYYGIVDYELELEAPSIEIGKAVFDDLMNQFDVVEQVVVGKKKRAYKAKQSH